MLNENILRYPFNTLIKFDYALLAQMKEKQISMLKSLLQLLLLASSTNSLVMINSNIWLPRG